MYAAEKFFRDQYFADESEYLAFKLAHKVEVRRGKHSVGVPGDRFNERWGSSVTVKNNNGEVAVFGDKPAYVVVHQEGWYACWVKKGSMAAFPFLYNNTLHRAKSKGPAFEAEWKNTRISGIFVNGNLVEELSVKNVKKSAASQYICKR